MTPKPQTQKKQYSMIFDCTRKMWGGKKCSLPFIRKYQYSKPSNYKQMIYIYIYTLPALNQWGRSMGSKPINEKFRPKQMTNQNGVNLKKKRGTQKKKRCKRIQASSAIELPDWKQLPSPTATPTSGSSSVVPYQRDLGYTKLQALANWKISCDWQALPNHWTNKNTLNTASNWFL